MEVAGLYRRRWATGAACVGLIKRSEGLRLEAYRCPAGIWTIGWGHTANVAEGLVITAARADELLAADIIATERDLAGVLTAPVTQGMWDALISLAFNLRGGARTLPRVAPKLWYALETCNYPAAAREFLDIDHGGGRELAGLTARRAAEAAMFLG